jgi:Xaa-Pro aminopeptidase
MPSHAHARLRGVLEAEGLDALVATTTENLYYVTGFRSISHALFRGLELYGIFTRRGMGLLIPFIDTAGVAADELSIRKYGRVDRKSIRDTLEEIDVKDSRWDRSSSTSITRPGSTALTAVLVLSYDLVVGHVGSLSLAHPTFFGIGAYATALLATQAGRPFPAGLG